MSWDRDEELENETVRQAAAIDSMTPEEVQARLSGQVPTPATAPASPSTGWAERVQQVLDVDNKTEADLRYEKAGLYRALRTQPLFAPGSASPEIVEAVTAEIRDFVLNRWETLMGVRSGPTSINTTESLTSLDLKALKALLAGLTEEDIMAFRLLLSKVTGKAPAFPAKSVPTVQPVVAPSQPTVYVQNAGMTLPAAETQPRPRPTRRRQTTSPTRKPMPTQAQMDAKVVAETATPSDPTGAPAKTVLGIAIQTALNQANATKESK